MSAEIPQRMGRYALFDPLASGGTATVYLARLSGTGGFTKIVCVKRLHPHLAKDANLTKMLLDEARIAARIRHPNVVSILDVISDGTDPSLVMEYVAGESLSRLVRDARERSEPLPLAVTSAIACDFLAGLHAAHETRDAHGELLGVVHRDVSPQNILVGSDGIARVVDFGIAKARGRLSTTEEGQLKGKLAYMAPEQLRADVVNAQTDVYSAGVVLWEMLTGRRLFEADSEGHVLEQVLLGDIDPPSKHVPNLPLALDDIVLRALERKPQSRYDSALKMREELEAAVPRSSAAEVGAWVTRVAGPALATRTARVAAIENGEVEATEITPPPVDRGAARARRRRSWIGVAVAAAVLIGVGIGARVTSWKARPDAKPEPEASQGSAASVVSVPAVTTPIGSVTARVEVPSAPTTRATGRSRASGNTGAKTPVGPTDPSKAACNPPYTRDADGVKVWKPECVLK